MSGEFTSGGGRSAEDRWRLLRSYASRIEADLDLGVLEEHGIPVIVQSPSIGIFGPGFGAATAEGVRVLVDADDLERALDLLGLESDGELEE